METKVTTFKCAISGSTFITPAGKTLRFMGPPGGMGHYSTSDAGEIEELMKLDKNPQAQIELVRDEATETTKIDKVPDPSLQEAAAEVLTSAERSADPKVVAAQANMAKILAAGKAA